MTSGKLIAHRAYGLVYNSFKCTMAESLGKLSAYAEKLSGSAKKRYKEKISQIGGLDPFQGPLEGCVERVPPVEASDLVSYLVLQTSFVTAKQFKAHKSLESCNQFVCGWVKEVKTYIKGEKFLITGHVSSNM